MDLKKWKNKGKLVEVQNHKLFCIHQKKDKPTIAFLHGYPSTSYDYYKIIPFLENDFSIVVHDHLGFGFSDKPLNYSYSLIEQAEMAIELWRQLGLKEIHLVAHDYGTTIANEIIVRKQMGYEPVKIKSLTLSNGSMHIELAKLKVIQKLLKHPFYGKFVVKLMHKTTFIQQMKSIWYDKSRFDEQEMENLWTLLLHNNGKETLHKVSQYNNERVKYWHRWIPALYKLDMPTLILWAQNDPIAVKAIAEQLNKEIPNSTYVKIDNCGHYPMLEQAEIWANEIRKFVELSA
ncbi:MAG: alpha/beta hydrolase [Bacteroidetes bacterium]|nr:alpha/beta hydrolase [Bacteroidota bacterium]